MKEPITFEYLNHRGERAERRVSDWAIVWSPSEPEDFYPQPGWFLTGFDEDKQAMRTFSLSRIMFDHSQKHMLVSCD